MYTVIGMGGVGCRVAKCFEKYPQYNIVCVDDEKTGQKDEIVIKKQSTPEAYEELFKTIPKRIKDKVKQDIILVLSGSSSVCSIALKFLYQIRDRNITILCVRPELDLLDDNKKKQEKVVFSVMQEYARSGLFKEAIVVDNSSMDLMIENASIKEYYPTMNNLITDVFHMIMVFDHQEPEVTNFSDINRARRVCSLGVLDIPTGTESVFYPMEESMDKRLYYGISKSSLDEDRSLQRNIISLIKDKNQEFCKYSYGVYETQYDSDFCYMKIYSSKVQDF